jgi:hypothetical protein
MIELTEELLRATQTDIVYSIVGISSHTAVMGNTMAARSQNNVNVTTIANSVIAKRTSRLILRCSEPKLLGILFWFSIAFVLLLCAAIVT